MTGSGYPAQYQEFFVRYEKGEYWEAHEVLEELWQTERHNGFYHGLIQVAAIMHQAQRGKVGGMRKLAASALRYLEPYRPQHMGVNVDRVVAWLEDLLARLPRDVKRVPPERLADYGVTKLPLSRLRSD
ncbi:MAG TPA: DUF309 domain-containing protein [Calditerricola sp.]